MRCIYVYCVRFILSDPLYSGLSNPSRIYPMCFYGSISDCIWTIISFTENAAQKATLEGVSGYCKSNAP